MNALPPVAAAGAASAFMAWAVRGRSASRLRPLRLARPARPPGAGADLRRRPQRKHSADSRNPGANTGAPATFFQCGANVARLPEIARAVAAGHEIGNHSYSHPYLFLRSPAVIEDELRRAQETIEDRTGAHARLVPRALRRPLVRSRARRSAGSNWPG